MEELRVCAFIDAMGTRDILMSSEKEKREFLISLVRRISKRQSPYTANAQNLGGGITMAPSAQATSFSDNIAISFPLIQMELKGTLGNKPHSFPVSTSSFFNDLISQAVITVWDAMKMGILIRGGICIGRLVHDNEIIAGEALVKAVELEKETQLPRIEIESEILELKDNIGSPIVDDYIKDCCLINEGERWFVGALDFHNGYWRDHNYFRKQQGLEEESPLEELERISKTLSEEFEVVKNSGTEKVIGYWNWFINELKKTFELGRWKNFEGASDAMFKYLD